MSEATVPNSGEEMSLRDIAAVLRRRIWLIIVPTLLVPLVAVLTTMAQTEQYRASTEVLIKEPPSATAIGAPERPMQQRVLQNELQRAQGSEIRDEARSVIGPEPTIDVQLASSEDVDIFVFTAESSNAQLAAAAADAYAAVYIDQRRASLTVDLEAQAEVLRTEVDTLNQQIADESNDEKLATLELQRDAYDFQLDQLDTSISLAQQSGATVIDAAQVPSEPFAPAPAKTGALALILGIFIGCVTAFLVDYFDNALRDEHDLASTSGLPILGVIPKVKNRRLRDPYIVTRELPSSPTAEAYRAFRTSVSYLANENDIEIVQVTSPRSGDGKTTTSVNLAVASARAGQHVLLIDCDLRRPRVHTFFELSNDVGFTTAMVGASLDEVAQAVDGEPNLRVISSGPILPDPSELLSGRSARRFIDSTREDYDLIIVDSPPALVVSDPLVVSGIADGVVLVASASQSDRRDVARAAEQLAQVDAPMLGAVLNAFDVPSSSYSYRHSYGVYESSPA